MKVGTRYSMFLGGALFGTAFATAGAGVAMHSLPLLYFGNCKYAVIEQSFFDIWQLKNNSQHIFQFLML